MNTYNPHFDYISAHLSFASSHTTFTPKDILVTETSYYKLLCEMYHIESYSDISLTEQQYLAIKERKNKLAYINYKFDLQWQQTRKSIEQSLLQPEPESEIKQSFVTIGFNHQEFDIKKCYELVKTILQLSIVLDGSFAVMENYRQNGEHPHVHFKIYHAKKTTKSTIVQTFFRARNARKYITNSNFIDVKPFFEYHNQYLDGIKIPEKMPYVELDFQWRQKNSLPDKVFKEIL